MVNQLASAITTFYSTNRYWPSTLDSLKPHYVSTLPIDPQKINTCKLASTSDGKYGYATYVNGWENGEKNGFMIFAQVEKAWQGLDYSNVYILTGSSPCEDSALGGGKVDWFRVANSRCTSQPWWTENNTSLAFESSNLQRFLTIIATPNLVYAHDDTSGGQCGVVNPPTRCDFDHDGYKKNTASWESKYDPDDSDECKPNTWHNLCPIANKIALTGSTYDDNDGDGKTTNVSYVDPGFDIDDQDPCNPDPNHANCVVVSWGGWWWGEWELAPYCNGKIATIWVNSEDKVVWWPNNNTNYIWTLVGTNGDDVMVWTWTWDIINGWQWNDTICGRWWNDTIDGWINNDRIDGWEGNDWINGWSQDDIMYGWEGNDQIYGQDGYDTSYGGNGDDILDDSLNQQNGGGWWQPDIMYGGNGNDILRWRDGADQLHGGNGNDTIRWDSQADTIYGGNGNDTINGWADNDNIAWWEGNDIIDGRDGDDVVYGQDGDDYLSWYNGDDWISWWLWADTFAWWYGSNNCTDFNASEWDTQVHQSEWNLSCNTSNGSNRWFTGIEQPDTSCTDNSFSSVCNTDNDGDGISNITETSNANSDAVSWYPADILLDRQDSNIVDADLDGVVNQLDPDNTNKCIPNPNFTGCAPVTPPVTNQTVVWVDCAAKPTLGYGERAFYVWIY